jgi:hypothetical protein
VQEKQRYTDIQNLQKENDRTLVLHYELRGSAVSIFDFRSVGNLEYSIIQTKIPKGCKKIAPFVSAGIKKKYSKVTAENNNNL